MVKPRAATAVDCDICGKTINRKADLPRHLKTHAANKEELMHVCPHIGCTYKALQHSNLQTHLNVHSGERPNKCPADGCEFACSDPGSLTRHRKERHGYQPKGHFSADTRKAARRQRRISPYTTSSSSSGPASPVDSTTDTDRSPCPPLPKLPGLSPPSTLPLTNRVKGGSKNELAAYSTELITKRAQVNDARVVPVVRPGNAPLTSGSGSLAVSEVPRAAEHPQLAIPKQGVYAVDVASQPVSDTTVSIVPLPLPALSYSFDNASVPASLPSPVVPYTVDQAPVPAPTPAFGPSYEVQYTAADAPFNFGHGYGHDGYGYASLGQTTSFDALFDVSHSNSLATPGINSNVNASAGVYPRSADVGQGYQNYQNHQGYQGHPNFQNYPNYQGYSYATTANTFATADARVGTSGVQGLYV